MTAKSFDKITACLDMAGCPNRCRHCWLGHTANGSLKKDDLRFVAREFRPFTEKLEVASWYREPDYKDDYKELWTLENELSDERATPHFENISFWRLVRDMEYGDWIRSLGVKTCQLTLFGDEQTTDFYYGRKGAFAELLRAFSILLELQIVPRIQVFVNQNNIGQLPFLAHLIEDCELEARCAAFGREFEFFLHQGTCDGANEQFYDVWVTPPDLEKIPKKLADYSLKHFGKSTLGEIFGRTEQDLYEELLTDAGKESYVTRDAVFYVDKDFNVYPNIETPASFWCLGNLKTDGAAAVIDTYLHSRSAAQHARLHTPIGEMVKACGNRDSRRLFTKGDYILYLLNQYCK